MTGNTHDKEVYCKNLTLLTHIHACEILMLSKRRLKYAHALSTAKKIK